MLSHAGPVHCTSFEYGSPGSKWLNLTQKDEPYRNKMQLAEPDLKFVPL